MGGRGRAGGTLRLRQEVEGGAEEGAAEEGNHEGIPGLSSSGFLPVANMKLVIFLNWGCRQSVRALTCRKAPAGSAGNTANPACYWCSPHGGHRRKFTSFGLSLIHVADVQSIQAGREVEEQAGEAGGAHWRRTGKSESVRPFKEGNREQTLCHAIFTHSLSSH